MFYTNILANSKLLKIQYFYWMRTMKVGNSINYIFLFILGYTKQTGQVTMQKLKSGPIYMLQKYITKNSYFIFLLNCLLSIISICSN